MCNVDLNNIPTKNLDNKRCYIFDDVTYYKVKGKKSTYYMKVCDYHKITIKQSAIILYDYTLNGLIQVKSYIKSIEFSDIIFIAPTIDKHFAMFDLEKI